MLKEQKRVWRACSHCCRHNVNNNTREQTNQQYLSCDFFFFWGAVFWALQHFQGVNKPSAQPTKYRVHRSWHIMHWRKTQDITSLYFWLHLELCVCQTLPLLLATTSHGMDNKTFALFTEEHTNKTISERWGCVHLVKLPDRTKAPLHLWQNYPSGFSCTSVRSRRCFCSSSSADQLIRVQYEQADNNLMIIIIHFLSHSKKYVWSVYTAGGHAMLQRSVTQQNVVTDDAFSASL